MFFPFIGTGQRPLPTVSSLVKHGSFFLLFSTLKTSSSRISLRIDLAQKTPLGNYCFFFDLSV